ncbi:sugar ABC transporter ATP-binding protein [Agriterribacter sp.]|uniref:sugar ABC transporter ATP-binding protein n=1 Tax=Agriterribacter sp. TaxID=2821509 RepID=UPI002C212213|nr:sugar ABC transporter ATP-binding protein [Agriterribacter sp.]HRO47275.1 sugar ABC transporter ATP-binding protein [Agriterribacter sp.]HRQ16561.1 sugar ABC transporter ATP-binding protein [Agriterribacter sp.]
MSPVYLLRAENISKSFPGVKALDNVQLHVEKGKVHAVMGENGAGKSTLMKILIGMYAPDAGQIIYKGQPITFNSVHDALKAGFSMIHQELLPFPELSVAENIFMGNEPTIAIPGWINRKKRNKDAQLLVDQLGLRINVTRRMKTLSVAEMQMVEIAKALSNKAEVIIMDEPTSALSDRETAMLFDMIRDLKRQGIAVIYISHKMDEILRIADTISVMRDGKYIATHPAGAISNEGLISLIVGRELNAIFEKRNVILGAIALSVEGLTGEKFRSINFSVRQGEILGIAGLMGAGRTEIVNAIFGLDKMYKGTIAVKGKPVTIRSPKDAIRYGIGLITEDRKSTGLVLSGTVKHNITLAALKSCCKGPFIEMQQERSIAEQQIQRFAIKTPSGNQVVNFLSGGNQQKIVLAKVLLNDPDIIILDEPTRGIDIGAKAEIYRLMNDLAAKGKAIIMISSELPEILGMSDRIIVVHDGSIKAELTGAEATQEKIMQYAMM